MDDNKEIRRQINKYLNSAMYPYPDDPKAPTDNYPYELEYVGKIGDTLYYIFDSGFELEYAYWDPEYIGDCPMAGMTLEDLADQELGIDWLLKQRWTSPIQNYLPPKCRGRRICPGVVLSKIWLGKRWAPSPSLKLLKV